VKNDFFNCGACGHTCNQNAGERCIDGVCVVNNSCVGIGRTYCNGACVTTETLQTSPIMCGGCNNFNVCQANQVCVAGQCTNFFASASCTTCPCSACGQGNACCNYPGTTDPVCVQGATCPQ